MVTFARDSHVTMVGWKDNIVGSVSTTFTTIQTKVSEIFGPVLQGEGYWVGTPSIFVRLFGCNFRCKFFGIKPTDYKLAGVEVSELIEQLPLYNTLEELPQVSTGCDTPFAIYKEFSKFTHSYTIPDLVKKIHEQASSAIKTGRRKYHLVFTGGEPLLWQKQLIGVIQRLDKAFFSRITFETNGTQILSEQFIETLNNEIDYEFLFSCSPKLSCSGESKLDAFNSAALRSYNKIINSFTILKFVVGQEQEIAEVQQFIKGLLSYRIIPVLPHNERYMKKLLVDNH